MDNDKLNFIEASFLVIIVMITHIILDLPNAIIEKIGSASIINVIYVFLLIIGYFFIINKLFSPFEGNNILYVADYVGGKYLKRFLCIAFIGFLLFTSGILVRDFAEVLKIVYFPQASILTIVLAFILVAIISNKFCSGNVIKANTLIMPPVLISIVIIFISSIKSFDFNSVFPILGHGAKTTFIYGSSNIYAFTGLIYLYIIRPNLKNINDYKKVGLTSIIISGLFLLLSVASLLMLFPFLTTGNETMSIYLSTRTVEFGRFFQRSDALFMFIWIFAFLSYLSVIIFYILKLSKESFGLSTNSKQTYLYAIAIFVIALLPQNTPQLSFLKNTVYKSLAISIIFAFGFSVLLIGYFKKKKYDKTIAK